MKEKKFPIEIGGRKLIFEINDLAEQASGAVFLRYGDTLVLTTATMSKEEKDNASFFPLTVDYEEKFYAAGKIRGPRYRKRESRPSDEAICKARLIDRAIRPLFPENLRRAVQVITTVLSWDGQNEPDVMGLLAASLALSISNIPWQGPVAALRMERVDGKFIVNPTFEEREKGDLDIVFGATKIKGEILINMLEGGFEEVDEEDLIRAYEIAKPNLETLIDFQEEIKKSLGKEKVSLPVEKDPQLEREVKNFLKGKLEKVIYEGGDEEKLQEKLINFVEENFSGKTFAALKMLKEEVNRIVHENIIEKEKRPDGRGLEEIRPLDTKAGLIPRTHGSGLFCRGKTKALSILTLGAPGDVQLLEGMEIVGEKRFLHHYNFPPFCSGEVKPMRGPGRREIGHGMLAERALLPVIPSVEEFPYTIRVVTEILSSNGSTSMASVCSSSLALMDGGVPIKRPVVGIGLGLMEDGKGNYKIITDIQGPEDHHGDMDFKVAGTEEGITAIQMDVKIKGISEKIFKEALYQSKRARAKVLAKIKATLSQPRGHLSPFAPRIITLQINPDKIRKVIGPGGKVINEIIEECGVSIDIKESGKVFITAEKEEAAKKAAAWIKNITREIKVGEIFQGKVKSILSFGAIVEILPGEEGLLHISQLAPYRVKSVEDVLKVGEVIPVKVIAIEPNGKISLSLKAVSNSNLPKKKRYGPKRGR